MMDRHPLTRSPAHPLASFVGWLLVVAGWLPALAAQVSTESRSLREAPLPGSRPGTERWIVWLHSHGFDLDAQLRGIRGGATRQDRLQGLAGLRQQVATDQAPIVQLIQANGGTVVQNFWVLSAIAVELPAGASRTLAMHPRVRKVVPVRARGAATAMPRGVGSVVSVPQANAQDAFNHNVDAARSTIQAAHLANPGGSISAGAHRGAGVRIAVLDTGLDENGGGRSGAAGPHDAFKDANGQSRVDLHAAAVSPGISLDPQGGDGISCNSIHHIAGTTDNPLDVAFRSCIHSGSAFHGTGVASIIAGRAHTSGATGQHDDGHAPDARLIDVAITEVPSVAFDPQIPGASASRRDVGTWTTSDAAMLMAVDLLYAWILETKERIHILNVSFDGWSDPNDPVSVALDKFAEIEDVLLVTSAGNFADDTRLSHGFYNGLAVGAVHARVEGDEAFMAMGATTHGPLASNPDRFYPDVCATGAGPGLLPTGAGPVPPRFRSARDRTHPFNSPSYLRLPRVDSRDLCSLQGSLCTPTPTPCGGLHNPYTVPFLAPVPSDVYLAQGTSEAAPQVAGAAALYRATRPAADAQETRAALLLNVVNVMPGEFGGAPPLLTGHEQHTYANRNTYGVGYVRDDFVAQFAVRDPAIMPLHDVVTLTGAPGEVGAEAAVPLVLYDAGRYAVVCTWPRRIQVESDLVNVDLEVHEASNPGLVLARSSSRGNSYERLAFSLPLTAGPIPGSGYHLEVRVRVSEGGPSAAALPVTIVGRRFEPDFDVTTSGVQFTPVHAATGQVAVVQAGVGSADCTVTAPLHVDLGTVPSAYESTWGSGPLTRPVGNGVEGIYEFAPPFQRGLNLSTPVPFPGGVPTPWNFHVHYSASVVPLQVGAQITGIAFRTWRPLECTGDLTINSIWMQASAPAPVSLQSLQSNSPTTAVRTTPYTLLAPVRTVAGIIDFVADDNGAYVAEVPFETPFTYTAGMDLHLWVACSGPQGLRYEVDFARDVGDNRYGMLFGPTLGGGNPQFTALVGTCPILGLIGSGPLSPGLRPQLEVHGEPMLGRSVEVMGRMFSPGHTVRLFLGEWAPNVSQLGTCSAHVIPGLVYFDALVGPGGNVRWATQSTPGAPMFPLDPALLAQEMGLQAMDLSTLVLSSAARLHVGGGL
jgi:hypothetical protein